MSKPVSAKIWWIVISVISVIVGIAIGIVGVHKIPVVGQVSHVVPGVQVAVVRVVGDREHVNVHGVPVKQLVVSSQWLPLDVHELS